MASNDFWDSRLNARVVVRNPSLCSALPLPRRNVPQSRAVERREDPRRTAQEQEREHHARFLSCKHRSNDSNEYLSLDKNYVGPRLCWKYCPGFAHIVWNCRYGKTRVARCGCELSLEVPCRCESDIFHWVLTCIMLAFCETFSLLKLKRSPRLKAFQPWQFLRYLRYLHSLCPATCQNLSSRPERKHKQACKKRISAARKYQRWWFVKRSKYERVMQAIESCLTQRTID